MDRQAVNQLINCLQRLSLPANQGKRKKKSRNPRPQPQPQRPLRQRRRRGPNPTPGTSGSVVTNNLSSGLAQGEVTIARRELLGTLAASSGTSVVVHPDNLAWLKTLAKAFERIRWLSLVIEYRPAVGANTAGTAAVGFDWMNSNTALTVSEDGTISKVGAVDKAKVLALTPSFDCPIWQRYPSLVVPARRLQSRAWYELVTPSKDNTLDVSPGSVTWYCSSTVADAGEIWISYKVHLSGTRA